MNLRSGYPFWLIKNGLPYDYPKQLQSYKTDVAIIGGGISGALTAYYLIRAGIPCILTDGRTVGLGSTCASTSLLQYEIDVPLCELSKKIGTANAVFAYEQCARSITDLLSIARTTGFKEVKEKKSLYFAAYKKDTPFIKKEFAVRKEHGFEVELLEQHDINTRFNFNAPAAILSQCGAEINAYSFTHSLLQYAIKKGLTVFDRTKIVHTDHGKRGVTLYTENGNQIKAKKVVYATGYEAVEFIDKKIVDLNSTYVTISEQANDKSNFWNDEVLLWNTADPYLYMRTTSDKRILVGGRDEPFSNGHKRDQMIEAKKKQLVKDFNKVFPGIEFIPEFSWTGTFGSTIDGLPFIGPYQKLPNSYFALGFGGNGITFSVIAAQLIRDLITGRKNKSEPIYSFDRV